MHLQFFIALVFCLAVSYAQVQPLPAIVVDPAAPPTISSSTSSTAASRVGNVVGVITTSTQSSTTKSKDSSGASKESDHSSSSSDEDHHDHHGHEHFDHKHKEHHKHASTITVDVHNLVDIFKQELHASEERLLAAIAGHKNDNTTDAAKKAGASYRTAARKDAKDNKKNKEGDKKNKEGDKKNKEEDDEDD